jgi:uncharacterized protein GlcG (DUF336 family)
MRLTLELAETIIDGAVREARDRGFKPLAVIVLDPGGHPLSFKREDGASTGRFQLALGKAAGGLFLGMSSRAIAGVAAERPSFVASLGPIAPAGIVPAPGGLLFEDEDGVLMGAVGISGDTSDNDEICAQAGLAAAGIRARG